MAPQRIAWFGLGRGLWKVLRALFDPYRPELHYLRGRPGPKCREKSRQAHEELRRTANRRHLDDRISCGPMPPWSAREVPTE
jgi:hypothetical protein